MIITHKINMDLSARGVTQRVDAVQDDKYSRNLELSMYANGTGWDIPDDTTAVIRYCKPDGTGGNYDTMPDGSSAYSINGNILTVSLAPQVCTAAGMVMLAVGLLRGESEINTFTINIVVHPNPGIDMVSENYTNQTYVKVSGWDPNKYLGTDENGDVIVKDGGIGKSAYQYAVDGGYTGTEEEFSQKLAGNGSGLPIPTTAQVGQYIIVAAVDDHGTVTATEAISMDLSETVSLEDAEGVTF